MWQSWLTGPKAQVDDMGSPTFGMQMAAIVQFVVIMTLIGPVAGMTMGNGNALITNVVYQQIYGVNGVVNSTQSNWITQLLAPLISQANSTSGFGAFIKTASSSGINQAAVAGMFVILIIVFIVNRLIWAPLLAESSKRYAE